MFERFTESARRTLFFSRYEASLLGSMSIESEHLLLGLIRESGTRVMPVLDALPLSEVRAELEARRSPEKVDVSVEIPFSAETTRILGAAGQEADRLGHRHLGPEHLLLGVLCEEESVAARTLGKYGIRLDAARERVREADHPLSGSDVIAAARARVDRILELVHALGPKLFDNEDAGIELVSLRSQLLALKALLDGQP